MVRITMVNTNFCLLIQASLFILSSVDGQQQYTRGRWNISSEKRNETIEHKVDQAQNDILLDVSSFGIKQRQRKLQIKSIMERRPKLKCDGIQKIVQCKGGIAEEVCKEELLNHGVAIVSDMQNTMFFAVCVSTQEALDHVAKLARVEAVEDNPPRTLSYLHESNILRNLQFGDPIVPYGVDLVKAREFWALYGAKGAGIKVCIIDTGLLATHEDVIDADISGSEDEQLVTPWFADRISHGTHVTGTIAARDNSVGIVGVAPEVSIYVARVFNDGGEFLVSDLVSALNACRDAGVNIINMSLGGPIESSAERSVIRSLKNAGILMVGAAGNNAEKGNDLHYPAAYEDVISVGAVNQNLHIATFSSHNTNVDIVAPGVDIVSMGSIFDRSYMQLSGTSMATPHVSAVAALLWSQFPAAGADAIRTAMEATARDLGACGADRLFGKGMVDTMAAASYLANGNAISPDLLPCVQIQINILTDDFGEETTYLITPYGDPNDILFRGGPYGNNPRAVHTDTFQLPDGCYDLILRDTFGDG